MLLCASDAIFVLQVAYQQPQYVLQFPFLCFRCPHGIRNGNRLFIGPLGFHFFASDAHMASATATGFFIGPLDCHFFVSDAHMASATATGFFIGPLDCHFFVSDAHMASATATGFFIRPLDCLQATGLVSL